MAVITFTFMFCLLLACSNLKEVNSVEVAQADKKQGASAPTSVDSRFFDLGGIIKELFPGFNQGNQAGPGRNPSGIDFPANSQFHPAVPIQEQMPPNMIGEGNNWPVIDDAKQYPNQGHMNTQPTYPNQGSFGQLPQSQYPNGNFGGSPQDPNMQYPNPGIFEGPNRRPQPNIFGSLFNGQSPSQGGFGRQPIQNSQFPNQGMFGNTQFPNQGNWQGSQTNFRPQNPDQGITIGSGPGLNQYPNQGNFGGLQTNPFPQSPNQINNGSPTQNQPGNLGRRPNQNNFGRGPVSGDGTLDSLMPPQGSLGSGGMGSAPLGPSDPNFPDFESPDPEDTPNAILGNPVIVPTTTEQGDRINFPTTTESPVKKQCVQDCETTSEYNPVCGSDNVTYINPGKFVCARNCGINVFVTRRGRCPGDTPNPRNVLAVKPVPI